MRIEIASSLLGRMRGMLARRDYPDLLLLTPCNDIHTFGMRYAIDVAFLSRDGVVLETRRSLAPRRRARCKRAASTLERIAADAPWFEQGDHIDLKRLVRESL